MRKSKLVFIIFAIVFFIILIIIALDISSRTKFPGPQKPASEQSDNKTSVNNKFDWPIHEILPLSG